MPGPNSGGICHVDDCGNPGCTLIEFGRQESRGDGHHRALLCEYHTGAMYDYFESLGMPPPALGLAERRNLNRTGRPIRFDRAPVKFNE